MNTIGVYGLGVMGRSLAKNLLNNGYKVSVYNYETKVTEDFFAREQNPDLAAFTKVDEFVLSLQRPRKIILMITAGKAVDDVIAQLIPFLTKDDIIMDCGNSYYEDTARRIEDLKKINVRYMGIGVSGGEKGALEGPSIMAGGDYSAYQCVSEILERISARARDGKPCCAYMGGGGAGHFVKMVHNGIEYALIQIICELYDMLRKVYGYSAPEISSVFQKINKGPLCSYLNEITAKICLKKDDYTDDYLINRILNKAGQKGTGKWTCLNGIQMDIPIPTIVEAVSSRIISNDYETRVVLNEKYGSESRMEKLNGSFYTLVSKIESAMYVSNICIYNQAYHLIDAAGKLYNWNLDLGEITLIWRNGCIIRADLLDAIYETVKNKGSNLLMSHYFRQCILRHRKNLNQMAGTAIAHNISASCLLSVVSYLNSYTDANSSANLLQAQRDYFGAHTYERKDRSGTFHMAWE